MHFDLLSIKQNKFMNKKLLCLHAVALLCGLFLAFLGNTALAQGVTTSSITGVVSDTKGESLPGATIVAVHTPSGTRYGTTTNTQGRYTLPAVRIGGPYRLTVTFVGFQEQVREIASADLGTPTVADFRLLEEGRQLSEVVVTSQRGGIIDAERTGASTTVKREQFERLPTLNRSFTDFSSLTPQASGNFSFGGRSNLYNNFSIDGATSNNGFGLSALPGGQSNAQPISVDAIAQLNVQLAPYDVSQGAFTGAGVNAVTRSGTNQFQGSVYGFTKNQRLANGNVGDVPNPLTNFTYNNYGFRLGGPILRNKLFFFVNYEDERQTNPAVLFPADAPGNQQTSEELRRLRDFLITPNNGKSWTFDPGTFDNFDLPTQSRKYLAKIDWNINDKNKFSIRYNQLNSFRDIPPSGSGGFASAPPGGRSNSNNTLPFSGAYYRINNNLKNVIAELNTTIGNGKFSNNLQVGYSQFRDFRQAAGGAESPDFPTVDILGPNGQTLTAFGAEPFTPFNRLDQNVFQLNDKFDAFLGNHTITVGTANEFWSFYNVFTPLLNGNFQFNSINDFIASATNAPGAPAPRQYAIQFSAIPGVRAPAAEFRANQFGFYAQDAYSGIKNLKLTLGLRADIPTFPTTLQQNVVTDSMNFNGGEKVIVGKLPESRLLWSPRLGFNWDAKGDKSIQVRGGTGIFTGRVPFVWLSNQVGNNGLFFGTFQPTSATDLARFGFNPDPNFFINREFPNGLPSTANGRPATSTYTINATVRDFRFPQVWRSNLAVDKTLPGGLVATLEGIYTKDVNAVYIRDANLADPVGTLAGDGRPLFGAVSGVTGVNPGNDRRINDPVVQALVLDNTSNGYAFSLTASLQKTTGRLTGLLAYTFTDSKDINNQSGSTAGSLFTGNNIVSTPNFPNLAFANNLFPHRVNGFVSYRFDYAKLFATTLSLIYEGRAAGNFSYVYGGNPNSDGISNNDLMYIPRNQNEVLLVTANAQDTRTPQQLWDQLNQYIEQDKYLRNRRGQYAERNGAFLPWVNILNFRLLQDVKIYKKNIVQFSWEINNVLNLLNTNWGLFQTTNRAQLLNFVGYETPHTATAPTTGRPIYSFPLGNDGQPLTQSYINNTGLNSRWQMQFGLRYIFE